MDPLNKMMLAVLIGAFVLVAVAKILQFIESSRKTDKREA